MKIFGIQGKKCQKIFISFIPCKLQKYSPDLGGCCVGEHSRFDPCVVDGELGRGGVAAGSHRRHSDLGIACHLVQFHKILLSACTVLICEYTDIYCAF